MSGDASDDLLNGVFAAYEISLASIGAGGLHGFLVKKIVVRKPLFG